MATAIQCAESEITARRWEAPQILRIDRYTLQPGTEAAVRNLHKQMAKAMVRWNYPQPCLAVESLTGPKEIWCMTGFQSHADQRRVAEAMERNDVLRTALERVQSQIQVLTGSPVHEIATFREDQGLPWRMGYGHFLTVTTAALEGSIYGTAAGGRYGIWSTRTHREANLRAATAVDARVFTVRAAWGMPAWHWVMRDQEFWMSNPVMKQGLPRASHYRKLTTFAAGAGLLTR